MFQLNFCFFLFSFNICKLNWPINFGIVFKTFVLLKCTQKKHTFHIQINFKPLLLLLLLLLLHTMHIQIIIYSHYIFIVAPNAFLAVNFTFSNSKCCPFSFEKNHATAPNTIWTETKYPTVWYFSLSYIFCAAHNRASNTEHIAIENTKTEIKVRNQVAVRRLYCIRCRRTTDCLPFIFLFFYFILNSND